MPGSFAVSVIKVPATILLHVIYRLAYVIKSGFVLPSLFASQLNGFQHGDDGGPDIDYLPVCRLKWIYLVQSLVGSSWCRDGLSKLYARILASRRAEPRARAIEILAPDEFTPDVLNAIIRNPRPVVIRGLASNTPAFSDWSFDALLARSVER